MSGATESTRGIRTLPSEGSQITSAEETWVTNEAAAGTWKRETPTGAVDGTNPTFTMSQTPLTIWLVVEGGAIKKATDDYSFSGTTLTFTYNPPAGSWIYVIYRY